MTEEQEMVSKDIRKLIRLGQSLYVSLPKEYVEAHKLKKGDKVEILFDEIIYIEPVKEGKLADVVKKIKEATKK
jgi:antitoxin component of MazEF toxin-antitoxin module